MKKIYVKPTIEVELVEANELMTGSGESYGQAQSNISDEFSDVYIDATDGYDESDAKGGSFACWEDDADSWALQ